MFIDQDAFSDLAGQTGQYSTLEVLNPSRLDPSRQWIAL